ncbi:MAG: hypothetical protein ACFFAO_20035 [Candidatus Hermodarchaeota archaeon]
MNEYDIGASQSLPPEPEWMKNDWAVDHKIQKFFPIPYKGRETIRWFLNRIFGPRKRYRKKTQFMPKKTTLNQINPEFKIGFVGDIMKMYGYKLNVDDSIKKFFEDVELVVGNLEGILTLQPAFVTAQRHNKEIIEELSQIKPRENWLLCLSNNHSGDFGFADFIFHLDRLRWAGFKVFGRKDIGNFLYKDKINFVSGSMWTNQNECKYISHKFFRIYPKFEADFIESLDNNREPKY